MFGYATMWTSEVGDPAMLHGLLEHADAYLEPSWAQGGLYYPRNDTREDDNGNWMHTDPFTGNSGIGYARLNVPDGQKKMWEEAWTPEKVQRSVAVGDVGLDENVDFLRCQRLEQGEAGFDGLVMTTRT